VLSQNDSTSSFCLHDMKVTSLRYLDAKFHHPSPKIKKIPRNTNGRLAIPALAGLLVFTLLLYNGPLLCSFNRPAQGR